MKTSIKPRPAAVGWVLFRAESLPQALGCLGAMAGLGRGSGLKYHPGLYLDAQLVLALVAGAVGSAPIVPLLARVRDTALSSTSGLLRAGLGAVAAFAEVAALSLFLLASAMLLAAGTHNPLIDFRF